MKTLNWTLIAATFAVTGCATTAQVTSVTAADIPTSTPVLVEAEQEITDQQVAELLAEYDDDGDGWAYVPPVGPRVIAGNAHLVVDSEEVEVEGRVVSRALTGETVRLADGRTVEVERLAGGSVRCSVDDVDCSWAAPEGAAVDAGRQVVPEGLVLTLPEPVASSLRDALVQR
ncbi:MAG: hypothetical protein U9Q03_01325 [Patescibacteria group bacterium]|nr:hypothetical protein [Patescibacteria group bacterium]